MILKIKSMLMVFAIPIFSTIYFSSNIDADNHQKTCTKNNMEAACGELIVSFHYINPTKQEKYKYFLNEKNNIVEYVRNNNGRILAYDAELKVLFIKFESDKDIEQHQLQIKNFKTVDSVTFNYVSKFE